MIIILSFFYSTVFLTGRVSAFTSSNVIHKKHTSYNLLQITDVDEREISYTRLQIATKDEETLTADTDINEGRSISFGKHDVLGSTQIYPQPRSLQDSPTLLNAFITNTHPQQTQEEQGNGEFIMLDWRKAWFTYGQCDRSISSEEYKRIKNSEDVVVVDPFTGEAEYEVDEIDGEVPDDLVGVLYRIGPGKFGVDGQRVAHILDADGLVLRFEFGGQKGIKFTSRFVETEGLIEERDAKQFTKRGTFGTGKSALNSIVLSCELCSVKSLDDLAVLFDLSLPSLIAFANLMY